MANPIVLLRGLARGQHHWMDFTEQMAQAFPEREILTIDLAGNGERYQQPSPETISDAVNDIRQQLQQQGYDGQVDVLGLSLGGMIALQWLQDHNEVGKALVINSSHAGLSSLFKRMYPKAMFGLLATLFMTVEQKEGQVYMLTSDKGFRRDVVERWAELDRQQPVSLKNFVRQIKAARSFTTDLKLDADKVLILASAHDHMVDMDCSKKLAHHIGCNIHFHQHAGHDLPLDDGEWVVQQAVEFFNN